MTDALITVGLCAAVTVALAAVGVRMLWRDWVALSAAEWDDSGFDWEEDDDE